MRDMMDGAMAWMMGGMGLVSILILLILVLSAAALLNYLFSTRCCDHVNGGRYALLFPLYGHSSQRDLVRVCTCAISKRPAGPACIWPMCPMSLARTRPQHDRPESRQYLEQTSRQLAKLRTLLRRVEIVGGQM